jgi:uncharacterized membrane protein
VAIANALVRTAGPGTLLTAVFGLAFVTFAPGYALVAAVFPESGVTSGGQRGGGVLKGFSGGAPRPEQESDERGIGGVERFVLSVGLSLAIVPLVGMWMDATGRPLRPVPVVSAVGAVTLVLLAVATVRRLRLPAEDRFTVALGGWMTLRGRGAFETRTDVALTVLLVVFVLFAAGSVGYAMVTPPAGDTEFSLLTENESGALVADGFPTEFERGESEPLAVSVANEGSDPRDYTVVVLLQRVEGEGDAAVVSETRVLEERAFGVPPGETRIERYDVAPTITGDRLRLSFLLYRGEPPERPTTGNAYRRVQLWIDVSDAGA